jgi:hypothetical protein
MGQSTDAILFWGYCWEEETSKPWTIGVDEDDGGSDEADDEGWEGRYALTKGVAPPPVPYDTEANKAQHAAYWAAKRDACADAGCLVDTHCSSVPDWRTWQT